MAYDGKILQNGLPRNDILVNNSFNKTNSIRSEYNLGNSKVLIYAPTFRDDARIDVYNINMEKLIDILEENTKCKWKILVKFHPNVLNADKIINFNDNVINCSDYGDINELFTISDALFSDYSSCIFDFMLLNKNIYL